MTGALVLALAILIHLHMLLLYVLVRFHLPAEHATRHLPPYGTGFVPLGRWGQR